MNNLPFEITKEEVLNLAAQKLVDAYTGEEGWTDIVDRLIRDKVSSLFADAKITQRIDEALSSEIERLLGEEVHPVDIWGEKTGQPTTIRAAIAERARIFWEVKVDSEGRETTYVGLKRSEVLMKSLLKAEFEKAVKTNAEVIVAEFKKAILADATKLVTDNINRLIKG